MCWKEKEVEGERIGSNLCYVLLKHNRVRFPLYTSFLLSGRGRGRWSTNLMCVWGVPKEVGS